MERRLRLRRAERHLLQLLEKLQRFKLLLRLWLIKQASLRFAGCAGREQQLWLLLRWRPLLGLLLLLLLLRLRLRLLCSGLRLRLRR